MNIFVEVSIMILLVTIVSFFVKALKQPYIVGYILTGIAVGPFAFNLLRSQDNIQFFSKVGITILLFIVGLGLNPRVLREVGKTSLVTGIGQIVFTAAIGYFFARLLGIDSISALYVSIALTFSSTIVVLKLLADKGDTDSLYGKISVGFMLVQDIVASIVLIAVSSLTSTQAVGLPLLIFLLLLKIFVVGGLLVLFAKTLLPRLLEYAASSQELLFLFSITWGMILASLFYKLGLSIEIGALTAGVVLSSTPYATEIGSRMKPLRDFFIILFFVLLGSEIALDTLPYVFLPALFLSAFVLIGKPVIVVLLMNLLGYKRKTGFMAGLTVAQISEFSLILASLGMSVGHVSEETLSLITLVGLFTIAGSTYMLLAAENVYRKTERLWRLLEMRKVNREKSISLSDPAEIILFGYDRAGSDFVKAIKKLRKRFIVVDFNPEAIKRLKENNLPYAFGDADDIEFLEELRIKDAKLIISTIPTHETNKLLVEKLGRVNPKAISIVLSHRVPDTLELYKLGASYVIMPLYLGARYASHLVSKYGIDQRSYHHERKKHLHHLQKKHQR